MPEVSTRRFHGRDGVELAYRELGPDGGTGTGRPLVLIHGYFSTAQVNWIRYGHAELLAGRGHRVIMPDLRAHGDSARPHDAAAYPPDVLADDGFALIEQLGLTDYDLGGYSLGARTVLRMLVRGAKPGRAVVAGTGLEPILAVAGRGGLYRRVLSNPGAFERGTPEWRAEAFLKTVGGDRVALLHILDTWVDTPRAELAAIDTPTLVLAGTEDDDHGSVEALAGVLPRGTYTTIPGNHMSAVTKRRLGAAIADYLAA